MANERLTYLFDRFMQEASTPTEEKELCQMALLEEHIADLQELLDNYWEKAEISKVIPEERAAAMLRRLLDPPKVVVLERNRFSWKRIAVAASIAGLLLASYILFFHKAKEPAIVQTGKPDDVEAPAMTKATITLADGKIVSVDSLSVLVQGGVELVKKGEGQIAYQSTEDGVQTAVFYNTLTNPRGSKVIDMELADGSHVWLNAGSSVTYPIAFARKERKVEITGEAYFEIAHDQLRPFIVSKNEMHIEVLGTKFNVNAYDDEDDIRVTLLEGSVGVSTVHSPQLTVIKPGEQAIVNRKNEVTRTNKTDTEAVMAWKNGQFWFNGNDINSVMRQISRWYDVAIIYEGSKPVANFRGRVSRAENVSEILKMLSMTETVKFSIQDKKVHVSRWKQ